MRIRAGIIGAAALGLALSAQAQTSLYASMAVAGSAFTNMWSTVPNLALAANNTWVGTQRITNASGEFKFAANGDWTTNWGGNASLYRVPAAGSASAPNGGNLKFADLSNGLYRFTFNDSTREFRLEWADAAPLPLATYTNMAVVGDFNGWTTNANSRLTNSPADTNVWSGDVTLENATAFQFQPNGNASNQWGAPETSGLGVPATDASACGKSDFTLSTFEPGTLRFTLNTSNATFSISQVSTQSFSAMTVQGNFIGTNKPPGNMTRLGSSTLWESDHEITNVGTLTVRFSGNYGTRTWGATNGAPSNALPAEGTLIAAQTNYARLTNATAGRYRITFNHLTGAYTFRQSYVEASGINLLKNSGFEQTTLTDGGDAVNWGGFQAWPKRVADGFAPHAGNWCGAIYGKLFSDWNDYGSFSQDVLVTSGKTYRASAWLKATANWTADSMQIKIEWLDAASNTIGDEATANIGALTTNWVKYSVDGTAPTNAARAHVVFLCSGADTTGTMHVDDVEMKIAASREQNFDTWGSLTNFAPFAPDWSITSGRTLRNVAPGRPPADVFISQYVEGTGNNKAIEIYNGLASNLDLAAQNYVLQQYDNGATNPSASMSLSGTIPTGDALVVGRPALPPAYAPDLAIGGLANLQTNKYLTFNGDDVVVLRQGGATGAVKDRVGQVGTNATGSIWSRTAKDHTLVRKGTIFTGTVGAVTSAFPLATEWTVYSNDTFSGLGSHEITFVDPNEPYTPGGYSLIMDVGAVLTGGEFAGGIGDVSFWYRTESMSPGVDVAIDTASSSEGPWTNAATLSGIALSNFNYHVASINRAEANYIRIRQTDAGTNRFRIDEIVVSEYSTVKRTEDFNAWTDPAFAIPGNYARYGWSIESASIATAGVGSTRAALLSAQDGAVLSPAYDAGVGEVLFWTKAEDATAPARLLLQTRTGADTNWVTQGTFSSTTGNTYTTWLYLTNVGAQARIAFDPSYVSGDALVDNVEVRVPALYRSQNFNGWPQGTYTNANLYQGWIITNCIVDGQNAYEGQACRNDTAVGNSIRSPYLPGGIGSFSFRARKWSAADDAAVVSVQTSTNGTVWNTLTNVTPTSTNYVQYSYYVGVTNQYYLRLYHLSGNARVLFDDIATGIYQPRPSVLVTPGLDPSYPFAGDAITPIAEVYGRYGATVLSVTSVYAVASTNVWKTNAMAAVEYGSYASISNIAGQAAGTMILHYVKVQYAGIGAATNVLGYATNVYVSEIHTNWVATIPQGDVWINEIWYAPYGDEPWNTNDWSYVGYNHEFIEICGLEGSDLTGWTIQLALGSAADIVANSNTPVYASYQIPTNTILGNKTNGYGFYVLGDQNLASNATIDKFLTITVPTNLNAFAVGDKDHVYDGVGVVRLLDRFGNEMYSLSYGGYASGSDRIPQSQESFGEDESIGLAGSGTTYDNFNWDKASNTVGTVNVGQLLQPRDDGTNEVAWAWHTQAEHVVPANTNLVAPFDMLNPWPPAHYDDISFYYGFTNAAYPSAAGTLYHRGTSAGAWSTAAMSIRDGSADAAGHAFVWATIPDHTYDRLQTIQYVIEVDPNKTGVDNSYLGSGPGSNNVCTIYTNLAAAQASPFSYAIPIADRIYVTNLLVGTTNTTLWTDGNDPVDPLVNFYVRVSTNMLQPTHLWTITNHVKTTNIYGQWTFNVRKTTNAGSRLFYLIQPLWP